MNKNRGLLLRWIGACSLLTLIMCENPTDKPPLTWRTRISAPVTNERFYVGDEIDSMFDFEDELRVIKEDTIAFAAEREDTASYTRDQKAFDTMIHRVNLGELAIRNAPEQSFTLPPLPLAGTIGDTITLPLQKIRNVVFYDIPGNLLKVDFINSSGSTLTNVTVAIKNIGSQTVPTVPGQSTTTFGYDVAGKTLNDSLTFFISLTSPDNSLKTLGVQFSFNGLRVYSMTVLDSLIAFSREYQNRYTLTDTINVDYVDIGDGNFEYSILNHCGVSFNLQCIHDHIWETSYCKLHDVKKLADLSKFTKSDSGHFNGGIPGRTIEAGPRTEATLSKVILSNSRLFPQWDDSLKTSISVIRFMVDMKPVGRYVTLTAQDSMQFKITTTSFKFKELAGTVVEPIEYQVDTQKVGITLPPWENTIKDSLRGRFILKEVVADLNLKTVLTGESYIDTLGIDFTVFAPESTTVQDSLSTFFTAVSSDSTYTRSVDITDVANLFSDSVAIAVKMHIPVGTYVRFANDLDWFEPDVIGKMTVNAHTNFQLRAKLDWEVKEPVNMDLGVSRGGVDPAFRYVRKMSDRTGAFELWVRNYTNLKIKLFTLVAPESLMDTLDSLSMNEVHSLLLDPEKAFGKGYIALFGDSGITIPGRDTTTEYRTIITLDDASIARMVETDSLNFRWWVYYNKQPRDALRKSDFIDIKSRLTIQADNNTDSLMIWKSEDEQ